jgi:hypothetical protein
MLSLQRRPCLQSSWLLFYLYFFPRKAGFRAEVCGTQLDEERNQKILQRTPKAFQENSIGLCENYSCSANFLPPRTGKVSGTNKDRICEW